MSWRIYLSGEIHTNWRDELRLAANEANLKVEFLAPETDHDLSDNSGANILGSEDKKFWHDHKGAKINSISCLLYTSPSPRDGLLSRMPSSA